MRSGSSRRNIRPFVAIGFFAASLCCAMTAVVVRGYNGAHRTVAEPLAPSVGIQSGIPRVPPSGGVLARIDVEVITVRPTGFERTQITRPKGLFGIAVENRSGLADITLRLDQEGGPRLFQVPLVREKLSWKQGLDLLPGSYVLTEANNSNWICHITITER
jgi:hypothetical protein